MTNPFSLIGAVVLVAVALMSLGCAVFGLLAADAGSLTRVLGGLGGYFATWAAALALASKS